MSHETEHQRMRIGLDRAATELDELTIARLRAARKRAVATAGRRPSRSLGWLPLSVGATVAFLAVAVTALWWRAPEPTTMASEELEWSVVKEGPDFFTDLEFYDWLQGEEDAG